MNKLEKIFHLRQISPFGMVKEESIRNSRIVQVFLIVAIIISSIMLVQLIRNRNNFDNHLLNGKYNGSLLVENESVYVLNVTFDGKGNANGTLNFEGELLEFSSEYIVSITDFSMAFTLNETLSFYLIGQVIDEGLEVSGDLQMYEFSNTYNGTYTLLRR